MNDNYFYDDATLQDWVKEDDEDESDGFVFYQEEAAFEICTFYNVPKEYQEQYVWVKVDENNEVVEIHADSHCDFNSAMIVYP